MASQLGRISLTLRLCMACPRKASSRRRSQRKWKGCQTVTKMGDIRLFSDSLGISLSTIRKPLPDGRKLQEWAYYVCHAKPMRLSVPLVPPSCLDVPSNLSEFSDNSQYNQNRQNSFMLHRMKVPYKIFTITLKSLGQGGIKIFCSKNCRQSMRTDGFLFALCDEQGNVHFSLIDIGCLLLLSLDFHDYFLPEK